MQRILTAALLVTLAGCSQSGSTDTSSSSSSGTTGTESSSSVVTVSSSEGNPSSSGQGGSSGQSSSGGQSSSDECSNDCVQDTQSCDGEDGFRICNNFDTDTCTELSPRIACSPGYVCSNGACIQPCTDECPTGTTACMGNGQVVTCGNFDGDACLELGAPTACPSMQHCESGACVPDSAGCTDECTMGATVCFGDSTRACGNFDGDACLDLGPPTACAAGERCMNGACGTTCTDECAANAVECSGAGFRTCGNFDADTCREWSTVTACTAPLICDQGACVMSCSDECAQPGVTTCSADGTGTRTCGQSDGDVCLDLSTAVPCNQGNTCVNGTCVPSCSDECQSGQTRCGASGGVETCGNFDGDTCLEFGGATACSGGAVCTNGVCNTPCTDDCSGTAGECVAGQNAFRTCGQFDTDACRDWSTVTTCQPWEVCQNAACALGPTPSDIVINELVYDSAGTSDSAAGNNLFVELFGPAGVSLEGWEIVGVNGNGGTVYNAINLNDETMGPDGFFVIAHPMGSLASVADISRPEVDFQNGPDSVQLRWRGRVVDALAYGSFSASDVFAGEGMSAPVTGGGKSLTRDGMHSDTDNNRTDFTVATTPSPRGNPSVCMNECTMGASQCQGPQLQTCGNFDGDACTEWSAPNACPMGQTCVAGACTTPCTDECTLNATRCMGSQIQTCVTNADADSCTEWGTAAACPNAGMGEQCINNACTIPCTDECQMGATRCMGSQIQTCVTNADADSCTEWGAAMMCMTMGESCVGGTCRVANAPEVVLIAPQGTLQTTQGNTHRMVVDATAAPGRTITEVRYLANGVQLAATTMVPHEYVYTVPANATTGGTITLQAHAVDNTGSIGRSAQAFLNVRNDVPVASFNAGISGMNMVTVDASAVRDTETALSALEVRWDWQNDGTWDTPFSTAKVATFNYGMGASATYTIKMEVKDAVGQTATTTRMITFQNIRYIGAPITVNDTWYGTIVITGDVTVNSGVTLTITEGTQVLFIRADTDMNMVGDYTLAVDGTLTVTGTPTNPVVFTGYDTMAKTRGGWDRILIRGTGSSISNAIVEYADVGIEARRGVTLNNVTVRLTKWDCIDLNGAAMSTLTDVTATLCGQSGVYAHAMSTGVTMTRLASTDNVANGIWTDTGSSLTVTESTLRNNGDHGVGVSGATLNLNNSTVELNRTSGVFYWGGNSVGTVTKNQIRQNAGAGVELLYAGGGDPNPVVTLNNIYSNSTGGTDKYSNASPNTAASTTCCSSTYSQSGLYSAPTGATIKRARVVYSEQDGSSYVDAGLLNGANGAVLGSYTSSFSGWVDLPDGITSLRTRVRDQGWSSTTDTITIAEVQLVERNTRLDVSVGTLGGTINLTKNYLGTYPDVLTRVSPGRPAGADLQGFVGVPFDTTWSTGMYKSGDTSTETWTGTVHVTGSVRVPAGQTLTLSAGTRVLFVAHDQNGDGSGDFGLRAEGPMRANGTSASPVEFTAYGNTMRPAFQIVDLIGTGTNASALTFVNATRGVIGIALRGNSTLTDVSVSGMSQSGVFLDNADNAVLTRVSSTQNGADGFVVTTNTTGATLGRITSTNNGGNGVAVGAASSPVIEDCNLRDNTGHGAHVNTSSPTIRYCLIDRNGGAGLWIEGAGSATANNNIIKFNNEPGVSVWRNGTGDPTPSVTTSNIFSNSVTASSRIKDVAAGITASTTCCSSTYSTSTTYTAPVGTTIRRIRVVYSEQDGSSYVDAQVMSGSTVLASYTSSFNGWLDVPNGTTSLSVRVRDQGWSSTTDSITIQTAQLFQNNVTNPPIEMAVQTDSGTTVARTNFWTSDVGSVAQRVHENRTGAVDFTNFTGLEYPATTVGPRP